ncbi:hypothetical protein GCM10007925_00210 [Sphingomonas astaxanthinifaciens DSM 22298]|uniref:Uncharacterized protein n=1 Tax=Sphingomonas astaxanthinifaciens DSM 22298 TaxID=1123267 RepID=A0ABQ5Z3T7_9SPHN|nr:hypothetical protein GCM10007925_00210 [Sphingomonas astaxanthinifaciens DSM 22298]
MLAARVHQFADELVASLGIERGVAEPPEPPPDDEIAAVRGAGIVLGQASTTAVGGTSWLWLTTVQSSWPRRIRVELATQR